MHHPPPSLAVGPDRPVTTPSGDFRVSTCRVATAGESERTVLVVQRGALPQGTPTDPAVHVECTTGDVLADLRCACGLRLRRSLRRLGEQDHGVLLYLRRDGSCQDTRRADAAAEDAAVVARVLDRLGRRAAP